MKVAKGNMTIPVRKYDKFLDSLSSPYTKEQYAYHLKRFTKYIKKDPLLLKQPTEKIEEYIVGMKRQSLSHAYRTLALSAIKHYYVMFDIVLNWAKITKFLGERTYENELRAYTHEEIAKLVNVADITYKAVILTYCSTGMRREALVHVKLSDMEYLPKYQIYKITIYKRSKFKQICYTTPEAAQAIKTYFKIENKTENEYFHNVKAKSVSMHLRKLIVQSGVGVSSNVKKMKVGIYRDAIPVVHGLRKFTITQMARAKVDTEIAKILTGHSIGVRDRYLNYSDEDLLEEYVKALDNLTINPENRLKLKVDVLEKNQQTRITALEKELHELTDSHDILVQLYEADPQERRKLKQLYREAKENGTRIPGQMLFLKKEEYTPNSFSYNSYDLNVQDQENKKTERKGEA
jgi:integrase